MEDLYREGKLKAIGVSNFYPDRLTDLTLFNEIVPAVNQVETNPLHQQTAAQEIMRKYNIQHEAWAPFAEGRNDMFKNPLLLEIGEKHSKSTAQVILRWLLQREIVVIPKTVSKERMKQNMDVFDFVLAEDEMASIALLDKKESSFFSHYDPAIIEYLAGLVR
jgi:2,5-diketo-D-gluconate reductase A